MCHQSVNSSLIVEVQNTECSFACFCGGHKNDVL